jgi:hypothetical protein
VFDTVFLYAVHVYMPSVLNNLRLLKSKILAIEDLRSVHFATFDREALSIPEIRDHEK